MDEGLNGLDECQDSSTSPMKIVVDSMSRMIESASLMKIALGSASQSSESTSRLGFSQPLDIYEPDKLYRETRRVDQGVYGH